MTRFIALICLSLCALAGCATKPYTADWVEYQCRFMSTPECFEACREYRDMLDQARFKNQTDCRRSCERVTQDVIYRDATSKCQDSAGFGEGYCITYCNKTYPR